MNRRDAKDFTTEGTEKTQSTQRANYSASMLCAFFVYSVVKSLRLYGEKLLGYNNECRLGTGDFCSAGR